jgi:pantoate--beta-alanine ligase
MSDDRAKNKLSRTEEAAGACDPRAGGYRWLGPMKKIESIAEMVAFAAELRAAGKTIGLVPTMGALHAGQEALMRTATVKADAVIVSLFVNPLQFGPSEVAAKYPRSLAADLKLCEAAGADCVFVPAEEEMFPRGYSTFVTEEIIAKPLCGPSRPTHFRGVSTVMVKLFTIIRPHFAFFGQKTAQQAAVVRKVSADLNLGVEIVMVPTVRELDGLAVGVRNRELTPSERNDALAISEALSKAKEMVEGGVRSTDRIVAEATHILGERRRIRLIYASLVDWQTMEPAREVIPGKTLLAIAVWVDEIRLIDNVIL